MRSQRQLKVGEELRHILAQLFQRGEVPWPEAGAEPIITVTEVQISPDLRNATAFFTLIGAPESRPIEKQLNAMGGFFRRELARRAHLRYVPRVTFKPDTSVAYAAHIERILHSPDVARDVRKTPPEPLDPDSFEDAT